MRDFSSTIVNLCKIKITCTKQGNLIQFLKRKNSNQNYENKF